MKFLDVKTRPLENHPQAKEAAEAEHELQFADLLRTAFDVNTKILADHGWEHPTRLGGLFSYRVDDLPEELREARIIVDAAGNVWRSLFEGKTLRAAAAGAWFGIVLGQESYRQYHKRISKQSRSEPKRLAYELFKAKDRWESAKHFEREVERNGIATGSRKIRQWYTEFNKKKEI